MSRSSRTAATSRTPAPGTPSVPTGSRRSAPTWRRRRSCATCPAWPPSRPVDEELLRVHDAAHIARVAALCAQGGGHFDADTYATPASDVAARVAAGGTVRAVDAVVSGEFDSVFAVLRPPGHHATASRAMGFCLYNNVAVAVAHARAVLGVGRVAIVDIDVHHGNGSEATFWNDAACPVHVAAPVPVLPGHRGVRGPRRPEAHGLTVNVPLAAGTSAQAWLAAFDEIVLPAVRAFEPELVVVSCGFDAHRDDPLAELLLDTQTYAAVAERLVALGALPSAAAHRLGARGRLRPRRADRVDAGGARGAPRRVTAVRYGGAAMRTRWTGAVAARARSWRPAGPARRRPASPPTRRCRAAPPRARAPRHRAAPPPACAPCSARWGSTSARRRR